MWRGNVDPIWKGPVARWWTIRSKEKKKLRLGNRNRCGITIDRCFRNPRPCHEAWGEVPRRHRGRKGPVGRLRLRLRVGKHCCFRIRSTRHTHSLSTNPAGLLSKYRSCIQYERFHAYENVKKVKASLLLGTLLNPRGTWCVTSHVISISPQC